MQNSELYTLLTELFGPPACYQWWSENLSLVGAWIFGFYYASFLEPVIRGILQALWFPPILHLLMDSVKNCYPDYDRILMVVILILIG